MSSAKLGQYCCPNTYDKILPRIQGGITAKSDCGAIFSRCGHPSTRRQRMKIFARAIFPCAVASEEADSYRSEP
jgi:hypothetical protein